MQTVAEHPGTVKPFVVPVTSAQTLHPSKESNQNTDKGYVKGVKLCVDKLTLTLNITKADAARRKKVMDKVADTLSNWSPHDTGICQAGVNGKRMGGYKQSVELLAPNPEHAVGVYGQWDSHKDAETLLFQCGPHRANDAFLRLEWNPSKWAPWQVHTLLHRIDHLLCSPSDLESMFMAASVTRLDIAADFSGVEVGAHYWARSKAKKRKAYSNEETGKLETLYLGSGKAKNRHGAVKVYDKAVEFGLPGELTRVECTVRSGAKRITVAGLQSLKSPFDAVQCLDVMTAISGPLGIVSMHRPGFLDSCILRGLKPALLRLNNSDVQKRLEKSIMAASPAFWQPKQFWQQWPAALHQALPFLPPLDTLALH